MAGKDPGRGVYAISVAADMVGTNIQNLRVYERRGLVDPARTGGGSRLYSETDLLRLTRIVDLLDEGLNLAGVAKVIELEGENAELRRNLDETP
jgi:DNA-binding transcriptional MerR regulator